jgi:WG containing repeat
MPKGINKWGYIDTNGEFVIRPRFESSLDNYVWPFEGGFAKIQVKGLFGYIDHSGEFAISPRFLEGEGFHDGMARVVVEGPCTYVGSGVCPDVKILPRGTKTGSSPPPCKYTFINDSSEKSVGKFRLGQLAK